MKINMKLALIVSLFLISPINTKNPRFDASFREFCRINNAVVIEMGNLDKAPPNGDKCTVNWGFHARDEAEAKQICMDMGIHHLKSWNRDSSGYPQCEYESIHICRDGWKQIRGRCYKILDNGELKKNAIAYTDCGNEGADLFKYYSEEIARLLPEYFADLGGIWAFIHDIKGSYQGEVFYKQDESSYNLLMAYGTANWYGLGYMNLVMLNDEALGSAMCEYIPQDTPLSFRVKMDKLQPYYHPGHADGVLSFWRTANYYDDRIPTDSSQSFRRECQRSMKPLLNSKMGNALDPLKTMMSQMPEKLMKANSVTGAPFRPCTDSDGRIASTAASPFRGHSECSTRYVTSSKYNIDCSDCRHVHKKKEFIVFNSDGVNYKIETYLKQFAPYWCTVEYYPPKDYKPCERGWTQYDRQDGSRWCHKHFGLERHHFDAKKYCISAGADLAGWEEKKEFEILSGLGTGHVYIQKNQKCGWTKLSGRCAKNRIFSHFSRAGDGSYEGKELIAELMAHGQPDRGSDEMCVDIRSDGLHDIDCYNQQSFFCSKEADEDV